MKPEGKIPIITKLRQTQKEPKVIGSGLEVQSGEHIKSFKVEDSEISSYVEKPFREEKAARETLEMYRKMHALGLPVVRFLKIVKSKEPFKEEKCSAAMEDLSAHGQNLVLIVSDVVENLYNPRPPVSSQELLENAANTEELMDQMAKALAVLHNNDIYEFHNQISFFIVVNKSEIGIKSSKPRLNFKILDYSNFTTAGSENSLKQDNLTDNVPGFKDGIKYNLEHLIKGVGEKFAASLVEKYNKYRQEKLMTYVP